MKKILALLLFSISCQLTHAYDIQLPHSVDMMAFSDITQHRDMYAVAEIMPVGWSESGIFAYIKKEHIAGRGGVMFTYVIMSAIDDETQWKLIDDWPESNEVSIQQSINKHASLLQEQFTKFGIVQNPNIELLHFPSRINNNTYRPEILITRNSKKDPFLGDIATVTVNMQKNDKKKRILYLKQPGALSFWIAGYFQSPFEDRIVVAIGEENWGFEGSEGGFIFSGCSLSKGFH